MVEGAGQVEAEVVGRAQDAVRGGAGLDGQDFLQNFVLFWFWNDVIENPQDVGLLGEVFLVGVVGEELALGAPALRGEARSDMRSAIAMLLGDVRIAEGLLEVGR